MTLVVVGSIAFDSLATPFGTRERQLGGSAVHFALAARFFTPVRMVGVVGEDFGDEERGLLTARGIDIADVETVPGGRTFAWSGRYGYDMNTAETLDTRLNVFASFEPRLGEEARRATSLFLANIQPELQRRVRAQVDAPLVALDSMNLWIDTARDALWDAISEVDCVLLNDAEARQLTGQTSIARAARGILERGPRFVVLKHGEYGASLHGEDGLFALPGYPLDRVCDPTGAGDSLAGGFVGSLAAHVDEPVSGSALRRALVYGSVLASFNVEDFGCHRVARLTVEEVEERAAEFRRFVHLDD